MELNDLLYSAGAVMPLDKIRRNDASYNAGFLVSKIYTDQEQALLDSGLVKKIPIYDRVFNQKSKRELELQKSTDLFKALNHRTEHDREAAARIAGDNRLVKGRKSPTEKYRHRIERNRQTIRLLNRVVNPSEVLQSPESYFNHDSLYASTERNVPAVLRDKGRVNRCEPQITPTSIQLQQRKCFNQYRIQHITQTPASKAPTANSGERYTDKLTKRAVTQIFESAAYSAVSNEGFTTFLTLTFTQAQRLAIFGGMASKSEIGGLGARHPIRYRRNMVTYSSSAREKRVALPVMDIGGPYSTVPFENRLRIKLMNIKGEIAGDYCRLEDKPATEFTLEKTIETTMGKEVSRILDAMKKMYQRGWVADHTLQIDTDSGQKYCDLKAEKVLPHIGKSSEVGPTNKPLDFHYIWVAECPANEDGEPNPHVHVLLKWNVKPRFFSAWAKRLEKIWGHGFAKLERIKKPKAAGSYIIKAVGYAAKGENAEQGLIRGNRYNISKCTRAPKWECLASFEADNMTAVIKELGYKLEQWKKPLKRQVSKLIAAKAQTIKAKSIAIQQGKPKELTDKMQSRIIRLEKQAENVNREIRERGVHVSSSNRFSVTFEGDESRTKVDKFLFWAAGARGWSLECRDVDMSDIKQVATSMYAETYKKFVDRQFYWKSVLFDSIVPLEPDDAEMNYWNNITVDYLEGRLEPMLS
ncbi:hypothetical protein F0229_10890 [Vibrio sp. AIC-3]|uniref:rolling circle replication-associated protein n=1 Tax=Vibrio sp. AIC-3 TaxID=2607604 RepID=UPI001493981A|nr:hypothetical protein [Vibrio sp. AIC-3]NOH93060.1 hypothetical protein [Vibrio sp. AIC-3]